MREDQLDLTTVRVVGEGKGASKRHGCDVSKEAGDVGPAVIESRPGAGARLRFGVGVLLAVAVALCASADAGPTDAPSSALWVTDGVVDSTALSGTTLYLGGSFGYIGPATGS